MQTQSLSLSFVEATKSDAVYISGLARRAMMGYVSQTWPSRDEIEEYFAKNAFDDSIPTWLLQNGVENIGRLSWKESKNSSGTKILVLDNIHIEPSYQSRGVGTLAIEALVLKQAREAKLPVCLMVLKTNPARSLYERLGFKIIGGTDSRHYMGWATPDAFSWDGDT